MMYDKCKNHVDGAKGGDMMDLYFKLKLIEEVIEIAIGAAFIAFCVLMVILQIRGDK